MLKSRPIYLLYFQPGFSPYDRLGSSDPELYGAFEDLDEAKFFEDVSKDFDGDWSRLYDFDLGNCWKINSVFEFPEDMSDEARSEYTPPIFFIVETVLYYK